MEIEEVIEIVIEVVGEAEAEEDKKKVSILYITIIRYLRR
jgi:hypothetical protein